MIRIIYPKESSMVGSLLISHPHVFNVDTAKLVVLITSRKASGEYVGIKLNQSIKCNKDRYNGLNVYSGGPCAKKMITMIHNNEVFLEHTKKIGSNIFCTQISKENKGILEQNLPKEHFIVSGQMEWGLGLLEQEITQGNWFINSMPNANLIFKVPISERWYSACNKARVDVSYMCMLDQSNC